MKPITITLTLRRGETYRDFRDQHPETIARAFLREPSLMLLDSGATLHVENPNHSTTSADWCDPVYDSVEVVR